MVECPLCFGEGQIDFRDSDAYIGEHWSDEEIVKLKARGMVYPIGVIECEECGGSGLVTAKRRYDIVSVSLATIDQTMAKLREQGLLD